uniref:Uncharacterized protein n=1 Tax=Cacopsylla melanoneura TaxID=428564 RepID=A0A8D8PT48_9HEMI
MIDDDDKISTSSSGVLRRLFACDVRVRKSIECFKIPFSYVLDGKCEVYEINLLLSIQFVILCSTLIMDCSVASLQYFVHIYAVSTRKIYFHGVSLATLYSISNES